LLTIIFCFGINYQSFFAIWTMCWTLTYLGVLPIQHNVIQHTSVPNVINPNTQLWVSKSLYCCGYITKQNKIVEFFMQSLVVIWIFFSFTLSRSNSYVLKWTIDHWHPPSFLSLLELTFYTNVSSSLLYINTSDEWHKHCWWDPIDLCSITSSRKYHHGLSNPNKLLVKSYFKVLVC